MRKIREVLRLVVGEGRSRRQVGPLVRLPYTTVADYVARAQRAGVSWPLPDDMDDVALEARLFPSLVTTTPLRPLPEWSEIDRELRRKGVTLQLLHLEYKERHPDGYQYTQFVQLYRDWQQRVTVVMRQPHKAGEKCFVDWAGATLPIIDPETGAVSEAQLFIAVMGASSYTFADLFPSQEMPHWISGHVNAFEYFGACPELLVPDNLKTGVTRACRYEPEIHRTYEDMAAHYHSAVLPARVRKPRDKAKAEAGVLLAERWLLASVRNITFFSYVAAKAAIRERLDRLNDKPFQKLDGSRRSLFEELERPVMRPLPAQRYEFADWKAARVNIDYHVEVERHYYSVPYQLVHERCDVRLTASVVEIILRGRRVASHMRSYVRGGYTTDPAHMPESHRRYQEWTPGRILSWAAETGPATAQVAQHILRTRPHPEQGYRSCLGIIRLGRRYGSDRVEAACRRALAIQSYSYRSVESILKTGLDGQPLPVPPPHAPQRRHDNVRGPAYYR
ncbi:MAG: IS21 family transposase [Candidatus Dormibacteria bacterium]